MSASRVYVLTADQRGSRRSPDRVPAALEALAALDAAPLLAPERTAGDEIQGVWDDPLALVRAVEALTRLGGWRIGIGVGAAERPLPDSTRAARGDAFVHAREAVEAARTAPADVAVRSSTAAARPASRDDGEAPGTVGDDSYVELDPTTAAQTALALLLDVLRRRTPGGWEVTALAETSLTGREIAARLHVSESAVSQRLARAGHDEARAGRLLAAHLLHRVAAPA